MAVSPRPPPPRVATCGAIGSAALHLLLLGALLVIPLRVPIAPAPEEGIAVELVVPPPPAPEAAPGSPPPAASAEAEVAAPPDEGRGLIRAERLLAGSILADARSREARETLALLDADERIEQLCNVEAMSQIHAWNAMYEPDRVVAYALGETQRSPRTLRANAAAFRSRRRWYRLRFECELGPDGTSIAAFAFAVGEPIPRSQWRAHDLPAIH